MLLSNDPASTILPSCSYFNTYRYRETVCYNTTDGKDHDKLGRCNVRMDSTDRHGSSVIETLADIYRQLFVAPGPGAGEKYLDIVERGQEPKRRDLSHFITSDEDSITHEETPAGTVTIITLGRREDFVTFLRIMANRCEPVDIPETQGASILDGVINWRKIERHMEEFMKSPGREKDATRAWNEEFRSFTAEKRNYRDTLIILSTGPYSAIPASRIGVPEDEWRALSGKIRKYHECTHFICRNLYPDKIDAVWDELVADAAGITAAFGRFDPEMEKIFLGIDRDRYTGGRLENYTEVDAELTEKVLKVLEHFSRIAADHSKAGPYELAVQLEEAMDVIWK